MSAGTFGRAKAFCRPTAVCRGIGGRLLLRPRSATPMRVRGIVLAALAYFIVRWRYRPPTWLWRFPGVWLYQRRCRANGAVRALFAHYSSPPRGSGESAGQGDTPSLRGCLKIDERPQSQLCRLRHCDQNFVRFPPALGPISTKLILFTNGQANHRSLVADGGAHAHAGNTIPVRDQRHDGHTYSHRSRV
jgi:hypothetical protein